MARRMLVDLRRALQLGPAVWGDLARATLELAISRCRRAAWFERELHSAAPEVFAPPLTRSVTESKLARARRVGFAVATMSVRVPWRADCVVQALAAQRWLSRLHIGSSLQIGVSKGADQSFGAHAWLLVGNEVVVGGDISSFVPLKLSR